VIFLEFKEIQDFLNTAIIEAKFELEEEEKNIGIHANKRIFLKGRYQGLLELFDKFDKKYGEKDTVACVRTG
jgi:hypothetical protein